MALYHFHANQITRSKAQSAVACAAYRAGEKLYSEYYGEVSDYTKKGGVICSEIFLSPHAPPEYKDRETLWNAVEQIEHHKAAQLAYSFDIALQNELTLDENIALAHQFVKEQFVSRGMIVDFAVHEPDKEDGGIKNPHFHVMAPIRPILPNGKWGNKQRRVYLLDDDGNRIRGDNGKWKYNSVPTTNWGDPQTLEKWREAWAILVNQKFEEKGLSCRIDHRSYERQGVDKMPTIHEGIAVRQMEAKGIQTNKRELNRWIQKTNSLLGALKRKISELTAWLKAVREQLSPPRNRDLAALLNAYYAARNAGAWSKRAKINNLKERSKIVNYLTEHDLSTVAELEVHFDELDGRIETLKSSMRSNEKRQEELKNLLETANNYRELKSVYDAMNAIKWKGKREKFRQEHEMEVKRFYMARRKLKPYCNSEGEFPLSDWRREFEALKREREHQYSAYKPLRNQLTQLMKIKHCVDTAIDQGGQTQTRQRDQGR